MIANQGYKAFSDYKERDIDSGKLRCLLPYVTNRKWARIRKRLGVRHNKLLTPVQAVKVIVQVLATDDRALSNGQLAIGAKRFFEHNPAKVCDLLMSAKHKPSGIALARDLEFLVPGLNVKHRRNLYRWAERAGDRFSVYNLYPPHRAKKIACIAALGLGLGRPRAS